MSISKWLKDLLVKTIRYQAPKIILDDKNRLGVLITKIKI